MKDSLSFVELTNQGHSLFSQTSSSSPSQPIKLSVLNHSSNSKTGAKRLLDFGLLTRLVSRQNGRVAAAEQWRRRWHHRQKLSPKLTPYFPSLRFLLPTFSLTFAGRFFFPLEAKNILKREDDLRRSVLRRTEEIQAHSSCAS